MRRKSNGPIAACTAVAMDGSASTAISSKTTVPARLAIYSLWAWYALSKATSAAVRRAATRTA